MFPTSDQDSPEINEGLRRPEEIAGQERQAEIEAAASSAEDAVAVMQRLADALEAGGSQPTSEITFVEGADPLAARRR